MSDGAARSVSDTEWDAFVSGCEYSGFMQSSDWGRVKAEEGWVPHRVAVREGSDLVACALVLRADTGNGRSVLYSPQGPALAWHEDRAPERLEALIGSVRPFAAAHGAPCWRIEPWALQAFASRFAAFPKAAYDLQPRHTALVPLLTDPKTTLASFKPKARYNGRLAVRLGVTVRVGDGEADIAEFFSVYAGTVERKGLESKPLAYFESIRRECGNCHVVTAFVGEAAVASLFLVRWGDRLTYFFGGSDPAYARFMAPYACHERAVRLGYELGCAYYDLWGIAGTDDPEHPWQPITRFKEHFHPLKVSLAGAYDIPFDAGGYERFVRWEAERNA